jgi:hypothetical protein
MSLNKLFGERLPVNRKERYYTGTVLPGIVCQDGFKYFDRLFCQKLHIGGLRFRVAGYAIGGGFGLVTQ